jgi:hypothetical protein
MLLTGLQIAAIAKIAGGDDCKITKLAGNNNDWAKVVQIQGGYVTYINPDGVPHTRPPGKVTV